MTGLAVQEPTSLVAVHQQCESIEAWAEQCESVPELRDAGNKLAAIDEYLNRTSTEGRSRVAAAMRRLEARIGDLLPPPLSRSEAGLLRHDSSARHRDAVLDEIDRHTKADFRAMAEHPEVVEEVIAQSTDDAPASRRKVMERIRDAKAKHPKADDLNPRSRAGIEARVAKAREMAAEGASSHQIAKAIGLSAESMADFRKRNDITVPADAVVGKSRRLDHNRMMNALVDQAAALDAGADLIDYGALDPDQIEGWVRSLESSISFLRTVKNRLNKEQT